MPIYDAESVEGLERLMSVQRGGGMLPKKVKQVPLSVIRKKREERKREERKMAVVKELLDAKRSLIRRRMTIDGQLFTLDQTIGKLMGL